MCNLEIAQLMKSGDYVCRDRNQCYEQKFDLSVSKVRTTRIVLEELGRWAVPSGSMLDIWGCRSRPTSRSLVRGPLERYRLF